MILAQQTLIRARDLAVSFGVTHATLCKWTQTDPRVRACLFRRGFYSVAKLRDAGLLTTPSEHVQNH